MDYDALLELLKKRRSIRSFKPDPVPDEYIDKIIDAALWAPSGADSQSWEFIVIKDPEARKKVGAVMAEIQPIIRKLELTRDEELQFRPIASPRGAPGFMSAPVFIVLCGDTRFREFYPKSVVAVESQVASNFASDMANAFLCMHLAATSLGLGSQWLTGTSAPYAQVMLKDALGIPDELRIYDTMVLGYPAMQPRPRSIRKRDDVVHHDRYERAKFRSEEQIKSHIRAARGG